MTFLKVALFALLITMIFGCSANAGVLNMQCTAPTQDNDGGTCDTPRLVTRAATDSMWVHFRWSGPTAGEDSVRVAPGSVARLAPVTVPPGSYVVAAWPSDSFSVGCTVAITKVVRATLWKVGGLQ